jgi:cytochrome c oxidase cbb3-type subunit 3
MSQFWNGWIILIVLLNIAGCWALLVFTRKMKGNGKEGETTGHVYDGIEEYNNPLPKWWLNLFYICLVFSMGYLLLYPGLGNFKGLLNWTQVNQFEEEVTEAKKKYEPLFLKYRSIPIQALSQIKQATEMGKRIFVNTCFGCHGSDARGKAGYPNLTDNIWLYGGSPESIEQSILHGRKGQMPAFGQQLTAHQIDSLVQYVGQLSGNVVNKIKAKTGKAIFDQQCFVCHGKNAKGNPLMGAPNLTDSDWLYGGAATTIAHTIRHGRNGEMPAHFDVLGKNRVHLVAAYVYSLSHKKILSHQKNSESQQ